MIEEINNCVFYDKNGKELMRFDRLSAFPLTNSIEAGSIPIADCSFSAYRGGLIGTDENRKVRKVNTLYEAQMTMNI